MAGFPAIFYICSVSYNFLIFSATCCSFWARWPKILNARSPVVRRVTPPSISESSSRICQIFSWSSRLIVESAVLTVPDSWLQFSPSLLQILESCSQESGTVKSADSAINLELQEKIWQILDEDSEIDGGVTRLTTGDLALRIFGHRAQKLQQVAEKIKKLYETEQI